MNCPHCNVPLMGGMTVCPKCKYDTKTKYGGEKHMQWLAANGLLSSDDKAAKISQEIDEYREKVDEYRKKLEAISKILVTSGFNFDGYKITKYSGYISGDDATQIPRSSVFGGNNGQNLTDALAKIRIQALKELKEAAYDLGCNAVIGVDFDYITLEPETANIAGGTLYEPYIICVTANGNAVVIERE